MSDNRGPEGLPHVWAGAESQQICINCRATREGNDQEVCHTGYESRLKCYAADNVDRSEPHITWHDEEFADLCKAAKELLELRARLADEEAPGSMTVDFAIVSDKDGPIARIDFVDEEDKSDD